MENYLKKVNQLEPWEILKILFLNQNSQFFQRIPCKQNFQLDKRMKKSNCVPAKHKHSLNQGEESWKARLLWLPLGSLLWNKLTWQCYRREPKVYKNFQYSQQSFSHIKWSKQFHRSWSADSEIIEKDSSQFFFTFQ